MLDINLKYTEGDLRAIEELGDFLPERIFDTHAHVFDSSFLPETHKSGEKNRAGVAEYLENMRPMLGRPKELYANLITYPDSTMADPASGNLAASDAFLVEQLESAPGFVGEIMVLPTESEEQIAARLTHPAIRGLKCYFTMSARDTHGDEKPSEYLPEAAFRVADERAMAITLHLGRADALADRDNIWFIRNMAINYPRMKLVLAHCARGFNARTVFRGIESVADVANVWFDFSAICESAPIAKIIDAVGVSRCTWGSDYPTNVFRGRAVTAADGFVWLDGNTIPSPWALGIENLHAVKEACELMHLWRSDVEDIFFNNAFNLFNI